MKIQKTIKCAAAIVAVCLATYSASAKPPTADYIGLNFVCNDLLNSAPEGLNNGSVITDWTTNVDALAPWETAGATPLLVQSNWMNLGRFGTNITLTDSNGTPTAVIASWMADGMFHAHGSGGNASYPTVVTNDSKLMDGFIECTWSYTGANVPISPGTSILALTNTDQPIIFLTGLGSFIANYGIGSTYSVIIYADTDGTGQGRVGQYFVHAAHGTYDSIVDDGPAISTDNTTTPPTSTVTPVYFDAQTNQWNGSNYTVVPVSATNSANAQWGNYIEFDGLTNDMLLIRTQNGGNPGAPINGIQIVCLGIAIPPSPTVPVPTPSSTVYGNSPVTLTETAKGTPPIVYQWQTLDNTTSTYTNIPGAETNTLPLFMPDTGSTYINQYIVILTNQYSYTVAPFQAATSQVCSVTVLPKSRPLLTSDVGNVGVGSAAVANNTNVFGFIGGNVTFNATFGLGTMPITNQWLFNNGTGYTPVAGVGDDPWTRTNVQSSSAGLYKLSATNSVGSSNSTPAHLTALADPPAPSGAGYTNMYSYCVYTNNPLAYWKFEETTNSLNNSMQAYDYSGNNFDATYGNSDGSGNGGCLDGGLNFSQNAQRGPNPNDYLNGYPGLPANNGCAGLSYGYNNGYLYAPPLNLNTNTVTFTMWIYPNDSGPVIAANSGLLMWRNGYDAAGVGFSGNQNANLTSALGYVWNNNNINTYSWNSQLFPLPQVWSFVAYVISPQNTTIYLYYVANGQTNLLKSVSTIANSPEAFSGGTTWIGSDNYSNGRTFNGSIDEVAVFPRAMSESQVQGLFLRALGLTSGVAPSPTASPVNTAVYMGQTLQLTVAAGGIPNPGYQWQVLVGTTWAGLSDNYAIGLGHTTNSTLMWTNFTGQFTYFRALATNLYGIMPSGQAQVTVYPVANWNKGLWTVNFAIPSYANQGPGTQYVGRALLTTSNSVWNSSAATNQYGYWNPLRGGNYASTPPGLLDDGVTHNVVNLSCDVSTNGNFYNGTNILLLDEYMQLNSNGCNMILSSVPSGKYNLAVYMNVATYTNRGTAVTVQGVTQSVTNTSGDTQFLPDNTVVYTNLVVTNGTLAMHLVAGWDPQHGATNNEGQFNGAQLQLLKYGPNILSLTNNSGSFVLTYVGGKLLEATNILGPWTTNTPVPSGAVTINPTGHMRFYRILTNTAWE